MKAFEADLKNSTETAAREKRQLMLNDPANWESWQEAETGLRYEDALKAYDNALASDVPWYDGSLFGSPGG